MRLVFFSICLFAQTVTAAPSASVEKSADGLTVYCRELSDTGVWAYALNKSSMSENSGVLQFTMDMSFMKCRNSAAGFEWVARNPFESISRIKAGKIDITLVDQVSGVLFDADTFARVMVPVADVSNQTLRFAVDATKILAEVGKLKTGESLTKKFYFLIEHRETFANGAKRFVSGGAYDFSFTWTKQAHSIAVAMSQSDSH